MLEKQGLFPKEEDVGMSLFLDSFSSRKKIDTLNIRRSLDQNALRDFSKVMVQVGGYSEVYEKLYQTIYPSLYGKQASFEIYVGYLGEISVVTGVLVLHAEVAGIYYVMTDPDYRRRGYGTEMMISLLTKAKERGYRLATLQASSEGKSLYQKIGFEEKCRFVEYGYK
jgi:ribosomal protein S18 acetylase RimI-like enzyme